MRAHRALLFYYITIRLRAKSVWKFRLIPFLYKIITQNKYNIKAKLDIHNLPPNRYRLKKVLLASSLHQITKNYSLSRYFEGFYAWYSNRVLCRCDYSYLRFRRHKKKKILWKHFTQIRMSVNDICAFSSETKRKCDNPGGIFIQMRQVLWA